MTKSKIDIILTVLIVLVLVFIWGNSCLSRDRSDRLSRWVLHDILGYETGSSAAEDEGNHILRKAAHFSEFALLAGLICLRFRRRRRCLLFGAAAFAAAALDETIQLFSDRGARLGDVMIDCLGALTGIILSGVLIYLVIKRRKSAAE